jgi:predicted small secreted protein
MKHRFNVFTLAALAACIFITGCNTMDGLGRDLEKAGEKVQNMSKK